MSTKRVFVLGLMAGGFYVAACGSTSSNVGDTGSGAGASGKSGSSGATGMNQAGASTAGASTAGASGDGTSGANSSGAGGALGTSGASTGGASGAGTSGSAGAASGGTASGGSAGHSGSAGSGGGPDCSAVKCGGALTACTLNQPKIPPGGCCPTCACGGACISDVSCPPGTTPIAPPPDPNICCQQLVCASPLCVGKQCGASCTTGEVPAFCDASSKCIPGGSPVCTSK